MLESTRSKIMACSYLCFTSYVPRGSWGDQGIRTHIERVSSRAAPHNHVYYWSYIGTKLKFNLLSIQMIVPFYNIHGVLKPFQIMSPAISPSTRRFLSSVNSRRSMFTTGPCSNKGSMDLWASTDPGKNIRLDSGSPMETSGWDWKRFTRWRTTLHTNWGWNSCRGTVRGIQWNTTHSVWRVKPRTTRYTWLDTREMRMTSWTLEQSRVITFITGWTSQHTIVTMIAGVAIVLPCMEEDGGTTTASVSTWTVGTTHHSASMLKVSVIVPCLEWWWRRCETPTKMILLY